MANLATDNNCVNNENELINDFELIDFYKNKECLYVVTSRNYKNRNMKEAAYDDIAKSLKTTISKYIVFID